MDIIDALNIWRSRGHKTNSFHDKDGNYIINFIKDGEVVGNITTYPGQGIRWNYPESLFS